MLGGMNFMHTREITGNGEGPAAQGRGHKMKKAKLPVTNAMRELSAAGIDFEVSSYEWSEDDLSGVHAAQMLGVDPSVMFKTLVARGERRGIMVFCIPVAEELDLKKCAVAADDKRVEMIHVKELPALTGYIRGGCSPVGMKKRYPTYIHESAVHCGRIYVSAGTRGMQVILPPDDLRDFIGAQYADLVR